ncbi:MAG: multinuclear nonheme iron-dependent oxidase [Bryobacteraceae bacterium]
MFDANEIPPLGVGLEYRVAPEFRRRGPLGIPSLFDYLEMQPPHVILDPGLLDSLNGTRALLHVSNLSLGSIGIPMDAEFLRLTCKLLRRTGSPWVSEHISWNRFRGGDTKHFVLPFLGEEVLETIVCNAVELRKLTGLPVLLENAPRTLVVDLPGDAPEGDFIRSILERADAGFLLDLESARATAEARGQDLWTYLRALPLRRTVEIHADDPAADREFLLSILDIAPVRAITLGWELRERGEDQAVSDAVEELRIRIGIRRRPAPPHAAAPPLHADNPVCLARGVAAAVRDGCLRVTGGECGVRLDLPVEALPLVAHFAKPQPLSSAFMLPGFEEPAAMGLAAGVAQALLEAGALGPPEPDGLDHEETWAEWGTALDFYLDSRTNADTEFTTGPEMDRVLVGKARQEPQPSAYKDYWAHPFRPLPNPLEYEPPAAGVKFLDVLLRRRSVRSFAPGPLDPRDLSALLFYVWGATAVQRNDLGDVFLRKTSPSGGCLHGAEVYPILIDVEGFESGLYHYSVRRHGLVLLSRDDPRPWIGKACGGQEWVGDASALFLMTFNAKRLSWKYGFSRAFRAALLDGGHLGQTFALVATWLGLAPFTTIALRDTMFEERLGLDYLAEPILLLNGVGRFDPANPRPDRPRVRV